ncbi:hypothetical protein GCM10010532_061820 [Dactylosporangium siamense]|uniref:Uncharacterized protein n=1 Tax=Dactylosporangium siamense TaxID=685454 RepID=A0A919UCU1_9ACTN|nr:hypothetical protein Dsi01nite_087680 [Dactylosporangium siamense]
MQVDPERIDVVRAAALEDETEQPTQGRVTHLQRMERQRVRTVAGERRPDRMLAGSPAGSDPDRSPQDGPQVPSANASSAVFAPIEPSPPRK